MPPAVQFSRLISKRVRRLADDCLRPCVDEFRLEYVYSNSGEYTFGHDLHTILSHTLHNSKHSAVAGERLRDYQDTTNAGL
jgi:hypothetical protein